MVDSGAGRHFTNSQTDLEVTAGNVAAGVASRVATANLAHNVELNRQCVEQTWQRVERRGQGRSKRRSGDEPSSGSLFKSPGPRGPPWVD